MRIQSPSYVEDREGQLYAGHTRVTVRTIVAGRNFHHYTPEELQESYPSVPLSTIYGVLAYYLDHQQELDERFAHEEAISEQARQAQRDDPNSMVNVVRRRVEAARKKTGTGE